MSIVVGYLINILKRTENKICVNKDFFFLSNKIDLLKKKK